MSNEQTRLQCTFFIKKKNRQCGMTRRADTLFCSEHYNLEKKLNNSQIHNNDIEDRIPCPLDPKHTVKKSQLKKHLTKCNKFKLKHVNDDQPFYKLNYNHIDKSSDKITLEPEHILATINILKTYFQENNSFIPTMMKQNNFMQGTRLLNVSNQKHALQQSSLIQNLLEYRPHEASSNVNVWEFGAGRAEFARYFNQVSLNIPTLSIDKLVLIDRSSNRLKFDTKIISDSPTTNQPEVKRLKIDIKDLYLDNTFPTENNIVISKHLCGVATDLTLRCIQNNKTLGDGLDSLCIAMCCRHLCQPDQYINPDFINDILSKYNSNNLNYELFFRCLMKFCSWATNGKRPGVQDCDLVELVPNHADTSVTIKEREQIGLMARQIIDRGRLAWVQENLKPGKSDLIKYCSSDISLENVALLLSN